ncbi:EPIDERMAL PATTERNING FACTOR-like protein 1 [Olea europaea var. sylvestris]|uniref:Epidermal patterning factor-like protein n=1 Tax=Olea europaea subsp. europaea TaxID=158383 RepID=A0A8S0RET2_OLEEU|nr:EPIDERMAL PATTERNING FACTOR-like protein 1 [Olea europaea var. sylvestris]XP_022855170.1 EPIDERMAL PATTERNING FACTOR-like protein 1 [Olea europaea var. sylvestris]CAA2977822.1 EPIDERMAL PATTERNING FACTOR 1 [Olea europaea subsp. europaea]
MAMTSLIFFTIFTFAALLTLLFPSYCLNQTQSIYTHRGLEVEEKTRLGSMPPSCHNKCNQCHPCMAVQVPTLPSHDRVHPGQITPKPLEYLDPSPSSAGNRYSNYKPLGWKCRCGGNLYNP